MNTFAWTYDSTYVYLYQDRYGSVSNVQDFWFYMDVNGNQLMEATDFILHAGFSGSNRIVKTELYLYVPAGTADAMVDVNGYADGYTLPGTKAKNASFTYADTTSGFLDGTGFETRVPWADLGFATPTAIYFHVSGANNIQLPGGIMDNCGSPTGGIGYFGFHSVDIYDNGNQTYPSSTSDRTVTYTHTIENTSVFNDIMNLSANSTAGFRLDLYDTTPDPDVLMATDTNGDGNWDYVNPAYDTESTPDGYPDTGTLAPGAFFYIKVEILVPANITGITDRTSIWVSVYGETTTDCVLDTTIIGDIQVEPNWTKTGVANNAVDFAHTVTNYSADAAIKLYAVGDQTWQIQYYYDNGGTLELMATDLNGDGVFGVGDSIESGWDSDLDGYPDTGVLSSGNTFNLVLRVTIPDLTPQGTMDTIVLHGDYSPTVTDIATDHLTAMPAIAIEPDYQGDERKYGAIGYSTYFPHVVTNSANSTDSAGLTYSIVENSTPVSWTVRFWTDPNCDGAISDGTVITGTPPTTAVLAANGGSVCIIAELQVPTGATPNANVYLTVTATSVGDGSQSDNALDDLLLGSLITCEDPSCLLPTSNFTFCQTVYVRGYGHTPLTGYTVTYTDPTPTVRRSQLVGANSFGEIADTYPIVYNDVVGQWTVADTLPASISLFLEPDNNTNTINPFATNRIRYNPTDNVGVTSRLNNTNDGGHYLGSTLYTVIVNAAETQYWDGSAWASYTGTQWTRTVSGLNVDAQTSYTDVYTYNNVNFGTLGSGVYRVKARWAACAGGLYTIAAATYDFMVGPSLAAYTDATYATPTTTYAYQGTLYLKGLDYTPSGSYKIAFYACNGAWIATSAATNTSGTITLAQDTSTWTAIGSVTAVSYDNAATPPGTLNLSDPNLIAYTTFSIVRTPTGVTANPATLCGAGTTDLSADNPGAGFGIRWYSASSGGTLEHTGTPWEDVAVATTTTYYAAIYNTSSGCESARVGVTVTVNAIPATPTVTPDGPTAFCAGAPISVGLTSSAAAGNQWYLGGSPIGGATGQTYTATAVGSYTVVVTVNGCASAPSEAVVVTVNPNPVVYPYFIPGAIDGTAYAGATFTAGGGTSEYAYAVTAGTVPPGLTFTDGGASDDTATLTGTPTTPGLYVFTVTVTDANGCVGSREYLVAVLPVPCIATDLTVTPTSIPAVTVGTAYSQDFGATGGTLDYTFQLGGILPDGLSFVDNADNTATISGTPTATGIYPITVGVVDAAGCTAYRQYVLVVTCDGVTLTLDPAALGAGTIGVPYSQLFTTSGGTGPYTYIQAGLLPAGMSFAGDTLSGTPTQGGTFYLMVASIDSNGCPGVGVYTLVVGCSAVEPTGVTADPATLCGAGTTDLSTDDPAVGYGIRWYSASSGGTLLHTGEPWEDVAVAATTTYYASTYEIASGCESARVGVTVTINPLPTAYAVTGTGSYCAGDAGRAVGLSNSQTDVSYQLYRGSTAVGSPQAGTGAAISFGDQTVGTYTVKATDDITGCTRDMTGNAVITENPRPTSNLPYANYETCIGGTVIIEVELTGTGPWNITWSDGHVQNNVNQNPAQRSVIVNENKIFSITGLTDSTGCSATSMTGTSTVTVFPPPTAAVVDDSDSVCSGVSVTITINLTGTGPWTLVWSDGNFVQPNIQTSPATRVVTPSATTVYSLISVTDAHCLTNDVSGSHTVTVLARPTAVVSGDDIICEGESADLTVTFTGASPWNIRWSDGQVQNGIVANPHTRTVYPTTNTVYTITQLSDANCNSTQYSGSATITVWTLPTSTLSGTTTICPGGSANLTVDLAGSGPWNLVWSDALVESGILVTPHTRTVNPAVTTTYSIMAVSGPCGVGTPSGSATVTVQAVLTNAGPDEVIWYADTPFNLTGQTLPGGLWSGTGITDGALGTFSPAVAGVGSHTITYTYFNDPCWEIDTKIVRVDEVWLLRNAQVTSTSPMTPGLDTIFTRFPGDPSLENHDVEAEQFTSGASFPHFMTDLTDGTKPLIFYQITFANHSLRLTKEGMPAIDQRIVITFDLVPLP